jgi:hypothetical protein
VDEEVGGGVDEEVEDGDEEDGGQLPLESGFEPSGHVV